MSVDGALECALLAAAIKTVCEASQPRRTILGVAASVASALMRPRDVAVHGRVAAIRARTPAQLVDNSDPAILLDSLRTARRAQRSRKKERRRVAKQAAEAQRQSNPDDGAADHATDQGEDAVAVPAVAPEITTSGGATPAPVVASLGPAASLVQPPGQPSLQPPSGATVRSVRSPSLGDIALAGTGTEAEHAVQAFLRSTLPASRPPDIVTQVFDIAESVDDGSTVRGSIDDDLVGRVEDV